MQQSCSAANSLQRIKLHLTHSSCKTKACCYKQDVKQKQVEVRCGEAAELNQLMSLFLTQQAVSRFLLRHDDNSGSDRRYPHQELQLLIFATRTSTTNWKFD